MNVIYNFLINLMDDLLSKKNIWLSLKLQIFALVFLLYIIFFKSNKNSIKLKNFLHISISTKDIPINILGINVDSQKKYIYLMLWIIISEGINTWSYKIYKNWYRNKLLDPKSKNVGMKNKEALIITNLWEVITYIPKLFNLLLIINTGQLQFLIPAFITRRIVSTYLDSKYLQKNNY